MRSVSIGDRVRISTRLWGDVIQIEAGLATIRWTKVRRLTSMTSRRRFPVNQIVPDAEPLHPDVPWRLRYWQETPGGVGVEGLQSAVTTGAVNPTWSPLPGDEP
jgi:hypothetical protein